MKKIFSILALLLLLVAFYPVKVNSQTITTIDQEQNTNTNRAFYTRCPRGCQWRTKMDCGSEGVISCVSGNSCGNCNSAIE